MKISKLLQWVGPAAILVGLFMVFSELSGLPIEIPYLSQDAPTGYDAVGSGVILFALMLLFVGMIGLYVRLADTPNPHRVQEYDLDCLDAESAEQATTTEAKQPLVEERRKTIVLRAPRARVLVVGTGLLLLRYHRSEFMVRTNSDGEPSGRKLGGKYGSWRGLISHAIMRVRR
jgi:hypothetical protein